MDRFLEIKIGSLIIPITSCKLAKNDWGESQLHPYYAIRVNETVTDPQHIAMTLLHEVLEVISEAYGLKLSECQIRILEQTLSAVVINNTLAANDWLSALRGSTMLPNRFLEQSNTTDCPDS